MMLKDRLATVILGVSSFTAYATTKNIQIGCRCIPAEPCWPDKPAWNALNASVSGQLIRDTPLALPCYRGPDYSAAECAIINENWSNITFEQLSPVGYMYPISVPCPPISSSQSLTDHSCSLGDAPVYTVNATKAGHVVAALRFARTHNLRLVVRNTGHDIIGRSTGFGSLQVWIKYLRTGIHFQEAYELPDSCSGATWKGSAFKIGGGYTWTDVYPVAERRNVVVVGGGTPSVGCLGGWMQGGGHSPSTHDFGLGADQVLEAEVILANGSIVNASPCQHPDLFFAIRGGGPSTYGIVISTTVKAWPTDIYVAQTLAVAPLTNDSSAFMEALVDIYSAFPQLSSGGYSGYGSWTTAGATPIFANFTTGYVHTVATKGLSVEATKAVFAPLFTKLQARNQTLLIDVTYTAEPSYAAYYNTFSGYNPPAGTPVGAMGSRLLDATALTSNRSALAHTLNILAGTPDQYTFNTVELVGGGQVFRDAMDSYSGVNPAWRRAYMVSIVSRGWAQGTPESMVEAIQDDITYNKMAALKALAPDTGAYMNEADRLDPDWAEDFYGEHFEKLVAIKAAYDPKSLFYCPTCVGSERFVVKPDGRLCEIDMHS